MIMIWDPQMDHTPVVDGSACWLVHAAAMAAIFNARSFSIVGSFSMFLLSCNRPGHARSHA